MKRTASRITSLAGARAGVALVAACVLLAGWAGATNAQLESRISGGEAELARLAASVEAKGSELALAQARAIDAAAQQYELEQRLASGREVEGELTDEARDAARRVEIAAERFSRASMVGASNLDDLLTRAELLERIREADTALVARVRELRAELERAHAEVEEARAAVAQHNSELAQAAQSASQVRAEAEASSAALEAARAAQRSSIATLESQIASWTQELQAQQAMTRSQAEEEVQRVVGDWVIPEQIVMCESGGDYGALNPSSGAGGAYQIMPSTWELYGGSGLPHEASPAEQDRIAAKIYAESGTSPWVCPG